MTMTRNPAKVQRDCDAASPKSDSKNVNRSVGATNKARFCSKPCALRKRPRCAEPSQDRPVAQLPNLDITTSPSMPRRSAVASMSSPETPGRPTTRRRRQSSSVFSSMFVQLPALAFVLFLSSPAGVTSLGTSADSSGKPNPFAYAGASSSTLTTPSPTPRATKDGPLSSERDRFIMSVFEALLSTMDAKLRRVENLDKAVEHLMRKMESLQGRVNRNIEKTEQVLSKLRAFDTKLFNVGNGKVVENLDGRLGSLDEKINLIDSKLSLIAEDGGGGKRKGRNAKIVPASSSTSPSPFSSPQPSGDEQLKQAASEPEPQTILASPMAEPHQVVTRSPRNLVFATSFSKNGLGGNNGGGSGTSGSSGGSKDDPPTTPDVVAVDAVSAQLTEDVGAVKESVSRIEARLSALTGVMWPKIGFLIKSVSEIHEAVIEDAPLAAGSQIDDDLAEWSDAFGEAANATFLTTAVPVPFAAAATTNAANRLFSPGGNKNDNGNGGGGKQQVTGRSAGGVGGGGGGGGANNNNRLSRIDRLITRVDPLATVSQKMDEVWSVVVGTKSSVDNLVPKSEQLLDKTQRQERAISNIHTDLTNMADQFLKIFQIIGNLYEVEKTLKSTGKQSFIPGSHAKFFQDVKDLPPGAREALLQAGQLIHSDVDSVPLVPIMEPPSTPTGSNPTKTGSLSSASSTSSSTSSVTSSSASQSSNKEPPAGVGVGVGGGHQQGGGGGGNNNANAAEQQAAVGILGAAAPGSVAVAGVTANAGSSRSSAPSIVFPSIQRKPVFLGSNTTIESALRDQAYKAYSCADLYKKGVKSSGVYYVQIRGTTYWYLKVFCNMEVSEGGWTVIHRRDDFGEPRESFNRDWDDYKHGFGDVAKEFWLGNENIFMLTNSDDCVLRVELEDFDGNKRFAEYSTFKLYSEKDHYKLAIGGYEGNAGDALNDPWYGSNFSPFSTYDRDNDRSSLNCASMLKGGWWWRSCGRGLNGLYIIDPNDLQARQGIVWFRWRGWDYTLRRASMLIRPKSFLLNETEPSEQTAEGSNI